MSELINKMSKGPGDGSGDVKERAMAIARDAKGGSLADKDKARSAIEALGLRPCDFLEPEPQVEGF